MDAEELQAKQRPIKTRYATSPEDAQATLVAQGQLQGGSQVCEVETAGGTIQAGLHIACGGDGSHACSANMLLESLVGCAGVTFGAVLTAMRLPVRDASLKAEGDIDFRGTLGVDKSVPIGFQAIRLSIELDGDLNDEQLSKVAALTEKYCVVHQTLAAAIPIELTCRLK